MSTEWVLVLGKATDSPHLQKTLLGCVQTRKTTVFMSAFLR